MIRVGVAPGGAIEIAVVTLHQTDGMRPVTAIESDHGGQGNTGGIAGRCPQAGKLGEGTEAQMAQQDRVIKRRCFYGFPSVSFVQGLLLLLLSSKIQTMAVGSTSDVIMLAN